jgi:hypothetical protein
MYSIIIASIIAITICIKAYISANRTKQLLLAEMTALELPPDEKWTRFFDMSSAGYSNHWWTALVMECSLELARDAFISRYEHDPYRLSKGKLCLEDYFITEHETLQEASMGMGLNKVLILHKDMI